jgi:hypothetical protein
VLSQFRKESPRRDLGDLDDRSRAALVREIYCEPPVLPSPGLLVAPRGHDRIAQSRKARRYSNRPAARAISTMASMTTSCTLGRKSP